MKLIMHKTTKYLVTFAEPFWQNELFRDLCKKCTLPTFNSTSKGWILWYNL